MKRWANIMAVLVVCATTSLFADAPSANAPMNDGVDRSDSKFVTHLFVKR